VVGAGGTIAMRGDRAAPAMDVDELVAAVPELAGFSGLDVENVRNDPGVALGLDGALAVARAARRAARDGRGVVVTSGTDTIEELAVLIDLMHDGEPPAAVTGAIRPASATGADGPANLRDAAGVAAAPPAAGLGCVVVFGGQIHAARWVRKVDATGPTAFGSFQTGPIGWVEEGTPVILTRPARPDPIDPVALDARVDVIAVGLGDDGALIRASVADGADGLIVVALGAGHLPPGALDAVEAAARRVPVVATVRPERGTVLRDTYGFRGSERDLRASGVIVAGRRSPAAARIALIAALGAGLSGDALRRVFDADDAPPPGVSSD
jgi:L-asparaginase